MTPRPAAFPIFRGPILRSSGKPFPSFRMFSPGGNARVTVFSDERGAVGEIVGQFMRAPGSIGVSASDEERHDDAGSLRWSLRQPGASFGARQRPEKAPGADVGVHHAGG